jgi:FeS assembly SUF system protein
VIPEDQQQPEADNQQTDQPSTGQPPSDEIDVGLVKAEIIETLRTVYDPEIPVNIYDLGLIYDVDVKPTGRVYITMTLTTPACPVAGSLPPHVEMAASTVEGVTDCRVNLVWDPPWTPDRMSEAAKLRLNMM